MANPLIRPAPIRPTVKAEGEYRRAVVNTLTQPTEQAYRLAVRGGSDEAIRDALLRPSALTEGRAAGIDRAVAQQANRVDAAANRRWRSSMRGNISADAIRAGTRAGDRTKAAWVRANRQLLREVRRDQAWRLRAIAFDRSLTGKRLKKALRLELGIQRRRVRTVTRDQTEKLVGEESRTRQLAAGIGEYVWETREDERVRPEHARLHGRIRTWQERPRPGEPINCRCAAIPNVVARRRRRRARLAS